MTCSGTFPRLIKFALTAAPVPISQTPSMDGSVASSSLASPTGAPQMNFQIPMYNFPEALNVLFDRMAAPPPTTDIHHMSAPHVPQGLEEL